MASQKSGDRRASARNDTELGVAIAGPGGTGRGLLTDLSYSGARLEACSWVPAAGSAVRLALEVPGIGKLELAGAAQRCTGTGFAVAFEAGERPPPEHVDRITALLFAACTGPRRG